MAGSSSNNASRVDLSALRSSSFSLGASSSNAANSRDGHGGVDNPRSKLVASYTALLSGEQPWASSSLVSSGKRRAGPRDEYLYDILAVPVTSPAQLASLFHSLLPAASSSNSLSTAYLLLDDDPSSAGARIRDNIAGLWSHAVAIWLALPSASDDDGRRSGGTDETAAALSSPLRLNAVQTLLALSSVVLSQRFPNYALDLITVLAGSISEADDLFIQLVAGIDDVLSEDFPAHPGDDGGSDGVGDSPDLGSYEQRRTGRSSRGMRPAQHLQLQHLTLQLLLLWLSHTANTSLGTYFLRRDLFESLTAFLERSALTARFGFEVGLAIGLLAGVGQQGAAVGMGTSLGAATGHGSASGVTAAARATHASRRIASLSIAHGAGPNPLSFSHPYIRSLALWYATTASTNSSSPSRTAARKHFPESHIVRPGMDTLLTVGAVALERQGWRLYVAAQPEGEDALSSEDGSAVGEGGTGYAEASVQALRTIVGVPIKGARVIGDEVMQLSSTLRDSLRWMVGVGGANGGAVSPGSGSTRSASDFAHLPAAPAAYLLPIYLFSRSNPAFVHAAFFGAPTSPASRRPSRHGSQVGSPELESGASTPGSSTVAPAPDLPVSVLSFASYLLTHASVPPPSASASAATTAVAGTRAGSTTALPRARAYARLMLCLLWVWLSSDVGEAAFLRAEETGGSKQSSQGGEEANSKQLGASRTGLSSGPVARVGRVRRCKQRGGRIGSSSTSGSGAVSADGHGPRLIGCLLDVAGAFIQHNVSLRLDVRSFSVALRIIRRCLLLLSAARIQLEATTALSGSSGDKVPAYDFIGTILRPLLSLARFLASRSAAELKLSAAAISMPASSGGASGPATGGGSGPSGGSSSTQALTSLIRLVLLTLSTYLVNADRLLPSTADVHGTIYELVREGEALRKLADGLVREVLGRGLDTLPLKPAAGGTRAGSSRPGSANASAVAADEALRSVGWTLALEPVLDAVEAKLSTSSSSKTRTIHREPASVLKLIATLDLEALLGAASLVGAGPTTGSGSSAAHVVGPGLVPLPSPPPAPGLTGAGSTSIGGVAPSSFSTFRDGFSAAAPATATAVEEADDAGAPSRRVSALLDGGELDEAWFEDVEEGALAEVARVVAIDVREMLPVHH